MSFRRSSEEPRRWQQWLARHRDALTSAGLPDWVYADELRWVRFLEEGGLDWESGWRVEMLSAPQAQSFQSFVLQEYGEEQYRCCLRALEAVVAGRHPA